MNKSPLFYFLLLRAVHLSASHRAMIFSSYRLTFRPPYIPQVILFVSDMASLESIPQTRVRLLIYSRHVPIVSLCRILFRPKAILGVFPPSIAGEFLRDVSARFPLIAAVCSDGPT